MTYGNSLDSGDTAWMLTSSALVFVMTPGLALFYGGLVRTKSALNIIAQNLMAISVLSIQWFLWGYSLSFHEGNVIFGDLDRVLFQRVSMDTGHPSAPTIPEQTYAIYQMMFAIIGPALITGATADRFKYPAYCIFLFLWGTLVYDPIAHMVWHPNGWLNKMGILDFAGGIVVHIIAATAALVCAIYLKPRVGYGRETMNPHSPMLVVVGTALLYFGWYGFNAGSAVTASGLASSAFTATHFAGAFAGVTWNILEKIYSKKPTVTGLCTGFVAGLATITPASGYVTPLPAMAIGILSSVVSYHGIFLRARLNFDDALDVFAVHGLGSAFGVFATGIFADNSIPGLAIKGGWINQNYAQLGIQILGIVVAFAWSAVMTVLILVVLDKTIGVRVTNEEEVAGLDLVIHGEPLYETTHHNNSTQTTTLTTSPQTNKRDIELATAS